MIFQILWFLSIFFDRRLLLAKKLHVHNQGFLVVKLKSSLRKFRRGHHDLVNRCGISLSQMTCVFFQFIVLTIRSLHHNWFFTRFVTRVTRRVSLVEQQVFIVRGSYRFHGYNESYRLALQGCNENYRW
jgi:hypothetical protein